MTRFTDNSRLRTVIKTRVQQDPIASTSKLPSPKGGARIWLTAKEVLKTEGLRGLWRGTTPTLYRFALSPPLPFLPLTPLREQKRTRRIPLLPNPIKTPLNTSFIRLLPPQRRSTTTRRGQSKTYYDGRSDSWKYCSYGRRIHFNAVHFAQNYL